MDEATKTCPMCGESILAVALKCRYCGEYFDDTLRRQSRVPSTTVDRMLLPVDLPASAITAGYLGLVALFPFIGPLFGIFAVVLGLRALKIIRRDPTLHGKVRAWFGIIAGGLGILVWGFVWIAVLVNNQ